MEKEMELKIKVQKSVPFNLNWDHLPKYQKQILKTLKEWIHLYKDKKKQEN